MNKEEAYDLRVNPIMAQVIETCRAHGIGMIATFDIPTSADDDLCCSTCIPDETGHLSDRLNKVYHALGVPPGLHAPALPIRSAKPNVNFPITEEDRQSSKEIAVMFPNEAGESLQRLVNLHPGKSKEMILARAMSFYHACYDAYLEGNACDCIKGALENLDAQDEERERG
jgi:hypothetical protein